MGRYCTDLEVWWTITDTGDTAHPQEEMISIRGDEAEVVAELETHNDQGQGQGRQRDGSTTSMCHTLGQGHRADQVHDHPADQGRHMLGRKGMTLYEKMKLNKCVNC